MTESSFVLVKCRSFNYEKEKLSKVKRLSFPLSTTKRSSLDDKRRSGAGSTTKERTRREKKEFLHRFVRTQLDQRKRSFGRICLAQSPLDDVCHCLPLAKIKIKTNGGEYYTKAAIKSNSSAAEPYLLGNRTADLIESSEKGVQSVNAVGTRSGSKEIDTNLHTENGSPIENGDQSPPPEVHEEILEIPQFDGMKEFCLANVTSSDFRSEQEKCPDL
ncbi:hypothetical protein TNCT_579241 [Trichonephila clavata]|uniref:Uncharacterized protein n=1 Tax=Trichonephila clavata TaxID=2740835 RepID=A0A8X6H8V4_TRICU|nr:hypothetical protein TNCT_579241 [Trichonephila clavata]